MKKIFAIILVIISLFYNTAFALNANAPAMIDKELLSKGIIRTSYLDKEVSKAKVLIEKDDKKYVYNLKPNGEAIAVPLQMGNGEYSVSILENTTGNSYKVVSSEIVDLEMDDKMQVFLNSNQIINFNELSAAVEKAKDLTKDLTSDDQKIEAIYNYIVSNYKYDYDKLQNLKYDYVPDVDKVLENKTGICYDFSSLFAAMLRSLGIPVKLVKGNSVNAVGYHAWNEVYFKDSNKFMVVDTTYDLIMKSYGQATTLTKDNNLYEKVYEY